MVATCSRPVKGQNRSNCDHIMKFGTVIHWSVRKMKWKGCPNFGQGKAAKLDFKMADIRFSIFRYIAAKKAPRILTYGTKYMLLGSTNLLL